MARFHFNTSWILNLNCRWKSISWREKKEIKIINRTTALLLFRRFVNAISKVMAAKGIHSLRFNQDQGEFFNFQIGGNVFLSYGT